MALVTLSLNVDVSPIADALDTLQLIHRQLVKFHGDEARQLERDIEAMADTSDFGETEIQNLGEGELIVAAPTKAVDAIRRARALGVLPA